MKRLLLLMETLLLISACASEMDQMSNGTKERAPRINNRFYSSTESSSLSSLETKVYADENLKVLWNADDRISVFNMNTYNNLYSFSGDDGDTAGGFDLVGDEGEGEEVNYVYAVYPYHEETSLGIDGVLSMTLPAEQQYKGKSFGIGANSMVAVTDNNFLAFKNVGGYLSLRLYGDNVSVRRITIKSNNGEKIAGKASITTPLGGVPSIVMDDTATDEISIVCQTPVSIGSSTSDYTDFWFVIPPVTFEHGFTITVTDVLGGTFTKSTSKSFTVSRNQLDWMNPLKVIIDYNNVFVHFEDDNFKAYCLENFDKNNDGELSYDEALAVKSIECHSLDIKSLSGIESFTNLEFLGCSNNQLTVLDLSKNISLIDINCDHNQLTNLDISGCTALAGLFCYNNLLTDLDVHNNKALVFLNCKWNKLTRLDISGCSTLTDLSCEYNQLASLFLQGCTSLSILTCFDNQLINIDVSDCYSISFIDCQKNQLLSINAKGCSALNYLTCRYNQLTDLQLNGCTGIRSLDCAFNQLTSLDVSNFVSLTELICECNPLLTEIWLRVSQSINSFVYDTNVATIKYKDGIIEIPDANFKAFLIEALDRDNDGEISFTEALYPSALYCNSRNIQSLAGIEFFCNLEQFDCHSNQLSSLDLSHNTALLSLDCSSNQLSDIDVSQNTALTHLSCYGNQLTSLDLSSNKALKVLSCDFNQITSLDIVAIP